MTGHGIVSLKYIRDMLQDIIDGKFIGTDDLISAVKSIDAVLRLFARSD